MIVQVCGNFPEKFISKLQHVKEREYASSIPYYPRQDFSELCEKDNKQFVDLLEKMLEYDIDLRIDAEKAIQHPYLSFYHDPENEPKSPQYIQCFEMSEFTLDHWKKIVWEEIHNF